MTTIMATCCQNVNWLEFWSVVRSTICDLEWIFLENSESRGTTQTFKRCLAFFVPRVVDPLLFQEIECRPGLLCEVNAFERNWKRRLSRHTEVISRYDMMSVNMFPRYTGAMVFASLSSRSDRSCSKFPSASNLLITTVFLPHVQ